MYIVNLRSFLVGVFLGQALYLFSKKTYSILFILLSIIFIGNFWRGQEVDDKNQNSFVTAASQVVGQRWLMADHCGTLEVLTRTTTFYSRMNEVLHSHLKTTLYTTQGTTKLTLGAFKQLGNMMKNLRLMKKKRLVDPAFSLKLKLEFLQIQPLLLNRRSGSFSNTAAICYL